jgi:predicted 2-oxoglutarate/Fe(II)-dependent dioxygenase YbiX/peroxiredoxin
MNFSIGDPVPGFSCASSNNPSFQFDSVAGRYLVLCFLGSAAVPKIEKVLDFITGRLRVFFDDRKVSFFGVTIDPADRQSGRMKQLLPGVRYFWDFERSLSRLYGALVEVGSGAQARSAFRPFTLVLDPNLRVLDHIPLSAVETHNQRLLDTIASLPAVDAYAQVPISAPVLIVPRVFEPDFCRYLIDLYERHGGKVSGSMIEKDGYTVGSIDFSSKRRKDYEIDDENVRAAMRTRLVKRLVPEIQKAFQFKATHIERYIVACYESENRGFFRPHRDNTTKGTAHRRFACSINLNAEDYEGGALRFPEFGTRTYSAPTGGAVVFSCSLLHEATSVTAGRRYATLPFLYDAQAAVLRAQNRQFLTGEIIDSERPGLGASDQGRTPE